MHPIVQKFLDSQLPEPMVGALLDGALPVPPLDLLQALGHAAFREGPLASRAVETLLGLPESLLMSAIIGPVDPPAPLGLILLHRREPALLEAALLHENLTAEWMERAIPGLPGRMLDIPLNNQVLWIERPIILDLLESHPEADYAIQRRVEEFRRDVLRQTSAEDAQERLEILDEIEAGSLDKAWAEMLRALPDPAALEAEAEAEPAPPLPGEAFHHPVLDENGQEIPLRLTQRIMKLRTSQKILLAQKGGKEERTILIREANRLIQVAVIRNGRLTEGEVAYIAQMRTVHEEVMRIISQNREWMKKYPIVKNLVLNPRTPLPIALNMLKRITEYDLKLILKDRNIAELLRREAKRMLEKGGKH